MEEWSMLSIIKPLLKKASQEIFLTGNLPDVSNTELNNNTDIYNNTNIISEPSSQSNESKSYITRVLQNKPNT